MMSSVDSTAHRAPAHQVRLGRIKATIWENATEHGVRHNVSLAKIYKDGEHWKETHYFGRDDLPLVEKVADLAHSWIYGHGVSHRTNPDEH